MRTPFYFLIVLLFAACQKPDHSAKIKSLDSLQVSIDSAAVRFSQVQIAPLRAMNDSVEKHLNYVQANYVGEMRRDMADVMSKYRSIKKLLPELGDRVDFLTKELPTTKKQLDDLKKALAEGATHDAAGNKLNEEYVAQLFETEKQAASFLIKEMNLIADRDTTARNRFAKYYPSVRFWVDSIPLRSAQ